MPWAVMYCATKWALHCIDNSLRRELSGSGIRVMKVCPGIVDTKFRDHVLAGKAPGGVQDIRRVVSPDRLPTPSFGAWSADGGRYSFPRSALFSPLSIFLRRV